MTETLVGPATEGRGSTPDSDELVARAAAFRDRLREGQTAAEADGSHSRDLHDEFVEAGFFHILHPRRYGGLELGLETFFRVIVEISRGDPGVGWNLCLSAGHAFHLASYYGEAAQEEILGGGRPFVAPSRTPPTGTATPVAGGYRLTGRWDYCSGSTFATHALVVAMVPGPDGRAPRPHYVVVPRRDFTVLDDWGGDATLGMAASASNTIVVDDAVVPAHYAVPFEHRNHEFGPEGTLGYQLHRNPLYLGRTLTFFNGELVATQVGAAFAALDEYEELMGRTTSFFPKVPRVESPVYQRWYGEIRSLADTSEVALLGAARRHRELGERWVETGRPFSVEDDVRLRGIILQAAQQATRAVDVAFASAGSSAARKDARMQKYYRDVAMYRTHIAAQFDYVSETSARQHFGQPLAF